jgi:hypothetical protein
MKTALTARARFLYLLGFLAVLALAWAAPHAATGTRVRRLGSDGRWFTEASHTDWTGVVAAVLLAADPASAVGRMYTPFPRDLSCLLAGVSVWPRRRGRPRSRRPPRSCRSRYPSTVVARRSRGSPRRAVPRQRLRRCRRSRQG